MQRHSAQTLEETERYDEKERLENIIQRGVSGNETKNGSISYVTNAFICHAKNFRFQDAWLA